jgi:hypothetical protein
MCIGKCPRSPRLPSLTVPPTHTRLRSHTHPVWLYYDGTNADEAGAREAKQNKNVVAAAKRQGVPHVVFSSLYDFGDKFPIPHCDSKVEGKCGCAEEGGLWV